MSWWSETFTLRNVATAVLAYFSAGTYGWYAVAAYAAATEYSRSQGKAALRGQRDDFNAAQKDRQVMRRSTIPPRQMVLGRTVVGGDLLYWNTTGDKKQYLHLVIKLADHECDAIEAVYLGGKEQPAWNATTGFIETGDFVAGTTAQHTVTPTVSPGTATVTLSYLPTGVVDVILFGNNGQKYILPMSQVTWNPLSMTATVTGIPVAGQLWFHYEWKSAAKPLVRVRYALGAHTGQPFPELSTETGGNWRSTQDLLLGTAAVYLRIEFDQDHMSGFSFDTIKFRVRGAKVRAGNGAASWSDNSARCLNYYLRQVLGATNAELPDSELTTQQDICDQSVVLDAGGATQTRYTCNGVVVFDEQSTPRQHLEQILQTMDGTCLPINGRYLYRAGIGRAADGDPITEDWLADGEIEIQPEPSRADSINRLTARYIEPVSDYAEATTPSVTNSLYVGWDTGQDLHEEVSMPMVHGSLRAQRMLKIRLEKARQGAMRVTLTCNARAYDVVPGTIKAVTLAKFGWSGKLFEVLSRRLDPMTLRVTLLLRETSSQFWDWNYGQATLVDLTPNSGLPSATAAVPSISGLTGVAGNDQRLANGDGTAVIRGWLAWPAVSDVRVTQGGTVEIEWVEAGVSGAAWQSSPSVPGDSTGAYIWPLPAGGLITARVRAVTARQKRGVWVYVTFAVAASSQVQWSGLSGRPTRYRAMSRGFLDTSAPSDSGLSNLETGTVIQAASRSYMLMVWSPETGAVVHANRYDVHAAGGAAPLAADLNWAANVYPGAPLCLWTHDEPQANRLTSGLPDAIYRNGGSRGVFGSAGFRFRSAYLLVARAGCGEGNGTERYSGAVDSASLAWCDCAFSVSDTGDIAIDSSGTGSLPGSVSTELIAGGAAADVYTYSSSALVNVIDPATVAEITVGPYPYDATIEVSATFRATVTPSGSGRAWMQAYLNSYVGGVGPVLNTPYITDSAPASNGFTVTGTFSYLAGNSHWIRLMCDGQGVIGAAVVDGITMRATVVKR